MHKPVIAVCDSERDYAVRLSGYLQDVRRIPCEISVFSSTDSLLGCQPPAQCALLVIAERTLRTEVCSAGFQQILVLNETGVFQKGREEITKYQSMENIARKIAEILDRAEVAVPGIIRGRQAQMIGFYTPVSRCLQTSIAISLGEILSADYPVLYLNLEEYSGLGTLLDKPFHGSLGDLLYICECAEDRLPSKLPLFLGRAGNLDVLPPARNPYELRNVTAGSWITLIDALNQLTSYSCMILDLSGAVDGLTEILKRCSLIYTIEREDVMSAAKLEEYERFLKESGDSEILERTIRLPVPLFRTLPAKIGHLDIGNLAAFVRERIKADGIAQKL